MTRYFWEPLLNRFDFQAFLHQFVYDSKHPLLFNSGFFVYFFTLFLLSFFALRRKPQIRRYVFCLFSLYFIYKASGVFVGLIIASAIVNYFLSNAIFRTRAIRGKQLLLILSIILNLSALFYFKYTNFFISIADNWLHAGFNPLNMFLPIGISFYTFENISYTIDVYRGDFKPAKKLSEYLLFLSFFPKLMMGPIVRAHDFVPQINRPYYIREKDVAKGFYLIISGLIKKLIISDFITTNLVGYIFDNPYQHTGIENLFAVYGYAIVIYCDFSGYSDIAIGIAQWLGFKIPPNFLSPYQSKSITEFWRRWHISLSSWLKDYLYIPLGGNRNFSWVSLFFVACFWVGLFFLGFSLLHLSVLGASILTFAGVAIIIFPALITKKRKSISVNLNVMTTMLLGGFWHGASWTFIVWGALHGLGLGIHKIWTLLTKKKLSCLSERRVYKVLMGIITFHFVCLGWIFFRADNFQVAEAMIHQILFNFNLSVFAPFFKNYHNVIFMIAIALCMHMIPDNVIDDFLIKRNKFPIWLYVSVFFLFLFVYSYFKTAEPIMPIYLQF